MDCFAKGDVAELPIFHSNLQA